MAKEIECMIGYGPDEVTVYQGGELALYRVHNDGANAVNCMIDNNVTIRLEGGNTVDLNSTKVAVKAVDSKSSGYIWYARLGLRLI